MTVKMHDALYSDVKVKDAGVINMHNGKATEMCEVFRGKYDVLRNQYTKTVTSNHCNWNAGFYKNTFNINIFSKLFKSTIV